MRIACAALMLLATSAGAAQGADREVLARLYFEQGIEAVAQGALEDALAHFQRSRGLVDRAVTTYNIGATLVRLGRAHEAIDELDRFLEMAPPNELEEERDSVERLRAVARAALVTVTLRVDPPDAAVVVDGRARAGAGAARTLTLDPGAHRIEVSAPGHRATTRILGERDRSLEVRLVREDPAVATRVRETSSPARRVAAAAIVAFSVGGAGLASLATFGGLALREDSRLGDSCSPDCSSSARLRGLAIAADVGLGVALLGGVLGLVFLLTDDGGADERAQIAPWVAPAGGGIGARAPF